MASGTLQYALPEIQSPKPRSNLLALCVGIVMFSAFSLWGAITSKGFLEADACTHYMFARHAINEPHYFTSVWGRPLCTGVYAIPAAIGKVLGVRVMSLILAIGCGLIGYRIARNQGYRLPALAAILLFAQPIFYLHSFSELTEIPFAFVMLLGFWAFQARNMFAMAVCISLTPMGRPEGLGLMMLAVVALIAYRRWYYILLMPIPLIIWSYFGWLLTGQSPDTPWYLWLKKNWPYAAKSMYGSGPWWHFCALLPVLVSPIIFPSLVFGIIKVARLSFARVGDSVAFLVDHKSRVDFMIAFIPLSILFVHTLLWTFGLMASNGELRYLLSVAPMWALLCARGWEWCWDRYRLPAPFLIAGVAALMPIFANMHYKVVPLQYYDDNVLADRIADWYLNNPEIKKDFPRIISTLPMLYYSMDISQSDRKRAEWWGREMVHKLPPGCILMWDEIYGMHNADQNLCVPQAEIEKAGWIWIGNIVVGGSYVNVYLSTTTIAGGKTRAADYRGPGIHP